MRVNYSSEVKKLGAGGRRVPELASFHGGFGIAREQAEVGVGSDKFAVGSEGRAPATAVTDDGRDDYSKDRGGDGGESDGEEFVGGRIGFGGVRKNERGNIGREGGKGDWRRRWWGRRV